MHSVRVPGFSQAIQLKETDALSQSKQVELVADLLKFVTNQEWKVEGDSLVLMVQATLPSGADRTTLRETMAETVNLMLKKAQGNVPSPVQLTTWNCVDIGTEDSEKDKDLPRYKYNIKYSADSNSPFRLWVAFAQYWKAHPAQCAIVMPKAKVPPRPATPVGFSKEKEFKKTSAMNPSQQLQLVADLLKSVTEKEWEVEDDSLVLKIPEKYPNHPERAVFCERIAKQINKMLKRAQPDMSDPVELSILKWANAEADKKCNKYTVARSSDSFGVLLAFAAYLKDHPVQFESIQAAANESPVSTSPSGSRSNSISHSSHSNSSNEPSVSKIDSSSTTQESKEEKKIEDKIVPSLKRSSAKTSMIQRDSSLMGSSHLLAVTACAEVKFPVEQKTNEEKILLAAAKDLAKFIGDGRLGNSKGTKVVNSPAKIKSKINTIIGGLLPQKDAADKYKLAILTLKLLEAAYQEIYAGEQGKAYYFTRKNNAYFLFFLNKNTSTSQAARSGTEQKHIKLLQKLFKTHFETVTDLAPKEDQSQVETLSKSKLIQFQTSYYARYAKEPVKAAKNVEKLFTSFKLKK